MAPCACGTNSKGVSKTWVVTTPTGKQEKFPTEIEARAAIQRAGGGTIRTA